jgi:DNA-binding winged helix-turn-helix (wHTH) protein
MSTQSSAIAQQNSRENLSGMPALPARYARFGTYQADIEREELYQNGQRVKVQAKLFQALLLLVSRAGEVVTREEVRRQLWPETFLANLDANVNTTMNKLRQVLGDSPESPVYIETIPRRGYNFIAKVEFSNAPGEPLAEIVKTVLDAPAAEAPESGTFWSNQRLRMFARGITLLFAGMVLGALLAFAWLFAHGKTQRAAADANKSGAVAEFKLQPPAN